MWILAKTDATDVVTSQRVGEEQTSTKTTAQEPNTARGKQQGPQSLFPTWLFLGLIMVVMYMFFFRGPRKKQQDHKKMVQSLKKNDRVRTIGGIIGTIVDVKGDEIVLKIDESNNTKLRVTTGAIGKNLSEEKKE